jgi:hypothetical protein
MRQRIARKQACVAHFDAIGSGIRDDLHGQVELDPVEATG